MNLNLQGKINTIKDAKDRIKAAIIAKGVTPSGNISTYANAISEIDTTNNQNKTVTENGVITPDRGYTGLGQVTVNVNQSVQDKVITSNGVYYADNGYIGLGEVEVAVPFETEIITVNPSVEVQDIETTVDGIEKVYVNPVTASIDSDIKANNIRQGVEILGVEGNIIELKSQAKNVTITNSGTTVIRPDSSYNGLSSVTLTPSLQSKTVTANGTIVPDGGYCGLSGVDVDIDLKLQNKTFTNNGTYTHDSGYNGFDTVTVDVNLNLQDKTITSNGSYSADSGYNGLENVTVNVQPSLQSKTITVNGTYSADTGYDGLSNVTVITDSVNNTNLTATSNGTYTPSGNYTGYGSVTVNVPQSVITGSGVTRVVENGKYTAPTTSFVFKLPDEATDCSITSLLYAFWNCPGIVSADLSSLVNCTENETGVFYQTGVLESTFRDCPNLKSADISNLKTVGTGNHHIRSTFYNCPSLTEVDLGSLTKIDQLYQTFYGCTSLTNVNFSSLEEAGFWGTFYGCTSLETLNFSKLRILKHNRDTFTNCTKLRSIDFSSLERIEAFKTHSESCFSGCNSLEELSFPKLNFIHGGGLWGAFSSCRNLKNIYFYSLNSTSFGSYTNQFNNMLSGVTGCTVHFPSNLQSVIGSWSSVTSGFGGTNTTVLFDLPATT